MVSSSHAVCCTPSVSVQARSSTHCRGTSPIPVCVAVPAECKRATKYSEPSINAGKGISDSSCWATSGMSTVSSSESFRVAVRGLLRASARLILSPSGVADSHAVCLVWRTSCATTEVKNLLRPRENYRQPLSANSVLGHCRV
jgi:hypothetical protein